MPDLETRISALLEAAENWLNPDNEYLAVAYERTVEEGYFSYEDIRYALRALRDSISEEAVRGWVERAGLTDENGAEGESVLCLHAGNIPLVGFQDAFATILSGATYYGKISRKDPYLLPTFLNEVKKTEAFSGIDVQWVHNLEYFEGLKSDAVLFAGSEESVPGVREAIERLDMQHPETRFLIRTAHFSLALLDSKEPTALEELAEAVLRYGGQGCRSVAVVVAPFGLEEVADQFAAVAEAFLEENPQHLSPGPILQQQFAYNEGIERPQVWLEDFLLQQGGLEIENDFTGYWVEGNGERAAKLADRFGEQLQTIYVSDPDITVPGWEGRTEPLASAQNPPLAWKPDGVDTLTWLAK